jgi:F-type H+-transporting ATPase subunit epsilon
MSTAHGNGSSTGMEVDLVSAERRLYRGDSTGVYARSVEGQIGVLPGHQPVLLELAPAPLAIDTPEGREIFAVHGGLLEYRGNRLTILADGAEKVGEVDRAAAEHELEQAREAMSDDEPGDRARRRLAVAQMRVDFASEYS